MALERKQLIVQEAGSLDQQVTELQSEQEKLTAAEEQLRAKTESFRSKKEVIKAQYSAAEAQVRISEAATGVGDQMADVGLAMQRALDKTEDMKARASAVEELQAAGTFEDLTALGPGQDDVDRQLAQIGATAAAIGPGIGPCCYEVGPEVLDPFAPLGDGITAADGPNSQAKVDISARRRLDLPEVARRLLREAGVEHVESAGLCTRCESELFFSHRRDGSLSGRQAGLVWIEA